MCQWVCDNIDDVPDFLDKIWFSDEAHFLLSGHVNSENNIFCCRTPTETAWKAITHRSALHGQPYFKHGIICHSCSRLTTSDLWQSAYVFQQYSGLAGPWSWNYENLQQHSSADHLAHQNVCNPSTFLFGEGDRLRSIKIAGNTIKVVQSRKRASIFCTIMSLCFTLLGSSARQKFSACDWVTRHAYATADFG